MQYERVRHLSIFLNIIYGHPLWIHVKLLALWISGLQDSSIGSMAIALKFRMLMYLFKIFEHFSWTFFYTFLSLAWQTSRTLIHLLLGSRFTVFGQAYVAECFLRSIYSNTYHWFNYFRRNCFSSHPTDHEVWPVWAVWPWLSTRQVSTVKPALSGHSERN